MGWSRTIQAVACHRALASHVLLLGSWLAVGQPGATRCAKRATPCGHIGFGPSLIPALPSNFAGTKRSRFWARFLGPRLGLREKQPRFAPAASLEAIGPRALSCRADTERRHCVRNRLSWSRASRRGSWQRSMTNLVLPSGRPSRSWRQQARPILWCARATFAAVGLWRSSYAASAIDVAGTLDPAKYQEPADLEYWNCSKPPCDVPRLKAADLTRQSFDRRVMEGSVFIVEDLGKDWPMAGWNCEYFRSDPLFSKSAMVRRYEDIESKQWVGFTSDWVGANVPSQVPDDPDAPQVAPYYWGIKDVQHSDVARSKTWRMEMLRKVQAHIRIPPFMDRQNALFVNATPEFWFSAEGAGAKAHMDSHPETTLSLQLAGTKRWRLRFMDSRLSPCLGMTYVDGQPYMQKVFSFELRQGEALFLPPGHVHETLGIDGCTASLTFQFPFPMATRLYRRFLPRVRRTADIHEVWLVVAGWATLHAVRGQALTGGKEYKAAREEALGRTGVGRAFREADANGDGALTFAELLPIFREEAHSALTFHDLDEDGRATREEVAEVYGFWAGTTHGVLEATPKPWRQIHHQDMIKGSIDELPMSLHTKMVEHFKRTEQALRQAEARAKGAGGEL